MSIAPAMRWPGLQLPTRPRPDKCARTLADEKFMGIVLATLLAVYVGISDYAVAYRAETFIAEATMVEEKKLQKQNGTDLCGWIGVGVSPMTTAFAESLGMVEPYGAIFDQPEPGSPAAAAHIEQGDVLTTINGNPLMRASDLAPIISAMAPGASLYLYTWRNGQPRQVTLILDSAPCPVTKSHD